MQLQEVEVKYTSCHIGEVIAAYLLQANAPFAIAFRKHMAEKASIVFFKEKGGQHGKNK